MGEHKINPIAQAAKAGLLPPKNKNKKTKLTRKQMDMISQIAAFDTILNGMTRCATEKYMKTRTSQWHYGIMKKGEN